MTAGDKLKPIAVARWGKRTIGDRLPPRLLALLEAEPALADTLAQTTSVVTSTKIAEPSSQAVLVKRKALVAMSPNWPTVESDLRHSGENGLAKVAKADQRGMWKEKEALEWARQQGKLNIAHTQPSVDNLTRSIHRMTR